MTRRLDPSSPSSSVNPLYGTTIRSTVLSGQVSAIRWRADFAREQVVTVDHHDLPPVDRVAAVLGGQPLLVEETIRHLGEPILLLAAETPELRDEAARAVTIDCDEHEAVLTIEKALTAFNLLFADDNVYVRHDYQRGDLRAGFAAADYVREDKFHVGCLEPMSLHPLHATALPTDGGGLVISGPFADPERVHQAVRTIFDLPAEQVQIQVDREVEHPALRFEHWPTLALHAALLARRAGRPVRLDYARPDDALAMARRHPGVLRHRSGFRNDGTLVARDILIFLDGGAYCGSSREVLVRALLHAAGPYRCPNLRLRGRVVATHTPPNGAPFCDGIPQVTAGGELHMNWAAAGLDLEPHDLRRRNVWSIGAGETGGDPGQHAGVPVGELLDHLLARTDYVRRRRQLLASGQESKGGEGVAVGIGLALSSLGCGLRGQLVEQTSQLLSGKLLPDYACGAHVVEVEVDRGSGDVRIERLDGVTSGGRPEQDEEVVARFQAGSLRALEFGFRPDPRDEASAASQHQEDLLGRDAARIELVRGSGTGADWLSHELDGLSLCGSAAAALGAIAQATGCVLDAMPLTRRSVLAGLDATWQPWRPVDRSRSGAR